MDSMSAREIAASLDELLREGASADECLVEIERSFRLMEYDGRTRINMRNAVGNCVVALLSAYEANAELCAKCVTPICLDENLWLFLKKGASPESCLEKLAGFSVKMHENLRLLVHYGVSTEELINKCVRSGVTISDPNSLNLLLRFGANPELLMGAMTGDVIAANLTTLIKNGANPDECAKRMKRRDVRCLSSVLIEAGGNRQLIAGLALN